MINCSCHHAASEHAPLRDFETAMCLVTDCDCEGTAEQVAQQEVIRERERTARGLLMLSIISTVVHDQVKAVDLAAAIFAAFDVEVK